MQATIGKEVIVSAGAIQSPPLLMRSGIGPKEHLEERNISCKVDLSVGKNYIDHVLVTLTYTLNLSSSALPSTLGMENFNQYITQKSGPLASLSFLYGRISDANHTKPSDVIINYVIAPRGSNSTLIGYSSFMQLDSAIEENSKILQKHDILFVVVSLNKAKSRGKIELDYSKNPIVINNYLSDPRDRATVLRAIRQQMNLMNTKSFQKLGAKYLPISIPECDVIEFSSDAYWNCYMTYVSPFF